MFLITCGLSGKHKMDEKDILAAVGQKYGEVATFPGKNHGFPVGYDFACSVGYPGELLTRLPQGAVESFAGLSTPVLFSDLQPGESVVDVGCGAGMDSLIASELVTGHGKVFSVEMSEPMILKARLNARLFGAQNIEFLQTYASSIPLESESTDVVFCNGIFNLSPNKQTIFAEIYRILKKGGRLALSEIVRNDETLPDDEPSLDDWFR